MYKVNPLAFDSVFALPSKVVDKHIRLAGAVQLKVLLWFYRHASNPLNIEALVDFIGLPKADVCDAITYWLDCGLLIENKDLKNALPSISEIEENVNVKDVEEKYIEEKDGIENNKTEIDSKSEKAKNDTVKENNIDEKQQTKEDEALKAEKEHENNKSENDKLDNDKPKKDETDKKQTQEKETKEADKKFKLPDIPVLKPTMQQIATRLEESSELRMFFVEAQNILGRTLGFDAQASLLMLHDHYGLPPSVILMICEYARSHNKQNSMTYILNLGKAWAEQEIDTFDKATEQLSRLEGANAAWSKFKVMAGIATPKPTMRQQEYLSVWVSDWQFSVDMIFAAYEEMAEKTGGLSFNYINKILQSWHKSDVKTIDDVEIIRSERSAKFKETKSKGGKSQAARSKKSGFAKNSNSNDVSYDLDEAERKANYEPLIYKKKGG